MDEYDVAELAGAVMLTKIIGVLLRGAKDDPVSEDDVSAVTSLRGFLAWCEAECPDDHPDYALFVLIAKNLCWMILGESADAAAQFIE
jgi:hypothetical protein